MAQRGCQGLFAARFSGPMAVMAPGPIVRRDRAGASQARGIDSRCHVFKGELHFGCQAALISGADVGRTSIDFPEHGSRLFYSADHSMARATTINREIACSRSLSDIDRSTAANNAQPSASFSAQKNPQRIPMNTPPVFPSLAPLTCPHLLCLVTKAMSDRLLVGRTAIVRLRLVRGPGCGLAAQILSVCVGWN